MKIPNSFKTKIKETFYDKSIKLLSSEEVVDDEGMASISSLTEIKTFLGNARFDNLAQIQEDYGFDEKIDIVITTDEVVSLGSLIEYEGVVYRVNEAIPYDSHNLIAGTKWLTKQLESTSSTSTSA